MPLAGCTRIGRTTHVRWNKRVKAERPEYPKLVPIPGTVEEARALLASLISTEDPDAEILDGGSRGAFARVHNEGGEAAARRCGERREFPPA